MRTTVDIPDQLLREAKMVALERGTTLRKLVVQGLESILRRSDGSSPRLTHPPIRLASDSPLRSLDAAQLAQLDADAEAAEINEVYHRR